MTERVKVSVVTVNGKTMHVYRAASYNERDRPDGSLWLHEREMTRVEMLELLLKTAKELKPRGPLDSTERELRDEVMLAAGFVEIGSIASCGTYGDTKERIIDVLREELRKERLKT